MICETCAGTGKVKYLTNPDGYYFYGDEPIIETISCEDCGGMGVIENGHQRTLETAAS